MFSHISRRLRKPIVLTIVLAAGAFGAGGGTAYAITEAAAGPAQPAGTVYACVGSGGKLAFFETGKVPHGCPSGDSLWKWAVTGPRGPQGLRGSQGPRGPQGPAGTVTPVTATGVTTVTNDADSGNHGDWAVDTFSRTMTVTRHGAVAVANCGGTATNGITTCYYYTATLADTGSFQTTQGALSPNAGTKISGIVSGTVNGGSAFEFYATSGSPSTSYVPATDDASTGKYPPSSAWPEVFFPQGTLFAGMNEINWSYTYVAANTCETWVDAYNNGDGAQPADGDITGVNHCTG
jgi:hypothetical protein